MQYLGPTEQMCLLSFFLFLRLNFQISSRELWIISTVRLCTSLLPSYGSYYWVLGPSNQISTTSVLNICTDLLFCRKGMAPHCFLAFISDGCYGDWWGLFLLCLRNTLSNTSLTKLYFLSLHVRWNWTKTGGSWKSMCCLLLCSLNHILNKIKAHSTWLSMIFHVMGMEV